MKLFSSLIKIAGCLALMFMVLSCEWIINNPQPADSPQYGYLSGKISIGPLCPVEQYPPDSACLPTMETYRAWATAVYSADKKNKLHTLITDIKGNFTDSLPSGFYIINYDTQRNSGIGSSNMPISIKIVQHDTTTILVNIDTGIR